MIRRLALVLLVLGLAAGGCARVPPWKRETLARPALQQPPWPMLLRAGLHVYEVREASRGAYGTAGGGCGCN